MKLTYEVLSEIYRRDRHEIRFRLLTRTQGELIEGITLVIL